MVGYLALRRRAGGIYAGLLVAAVGLAQRAGWAVHANAALLLALLLIGIRNAWDMITWMAPMRGCRCSPQLTVSAL